jgi:hypothetical protein
MRRRRLRYWLSNEANERKPHWVLILNWPGLEYLAYPVKVTRTVTLASLEAQFGECVFPCPTTMDKVLNCLKNKRLSGSVDYNHFLEVIVVEYLVVGEENTNFEDFCVKQYCERIAGLHLADKAGTTLQC